MQVTQHLTTRHKNARLAFAAFPHWADAVIGLYRGEQRNAEFASMAREARQLGYRVSACGVVIPPKRQTLFY